MASILRNHKTPAWVIPSSITALLWNLVGLYTFAMHISLTPETIAAMPEAMQGLYTNIPLWSDIAYGCAVTLGTLGSLCLVLKSRWAVPVLLLSFIAILVNMSYVLLISEMIAVQGAASVALPAAIIVIGALLVWLSRRAIASGWIK